MRPCKPPTDEEVKCSKQLSRILKFLETIHYVNKEDRKIVEKIYKLIFNTEEISSE